MALLTQEIEIVMGYMQAQANRTKKNNRSNNVATKERVSSPFETYNHEEDVVEQNVVAKAQPIQVEVHIDIPSYDGSINTKVWNSG